MLALVMHKASVRIGVVALSAVFFAVSLFFSAGTWRVDHGGAELTKSSIEMLFLGWLGPLGLQAGWYGNPMLLVSWALTGVGGRAALPSVWCAALALLLAASSFVTLPLFSIFGRNEGEGATLVMPGPGMILWFASFCIALAAAIVALRAARASAEGPSVGA